MKKELKIIPKDIIQWFSKRGIGEDVLEKNNISFDRGWIHIPIFSESGELIFNKLRRNPILDNSGTKKPKYKNELGGRASLYGIHNEITSPVFVVEGELDALCLQSYGISAVSSTAGSGTFEKEWADYFKNKETIILYDRDKAGYRGATTVQSIIEHAHILTLPKFDGKDITDFLKEHTLKDLFEIPTYNFIVPEDSFEISQKKKHEYKKALDRIVDLRGEIVRRKGDLDYLEFLSEYLLSKYNKIKNSLENKTKKSGNYDNGDIDNLKKVPIEKFLEFNDQGFALCLWHNEKTPSLYYNRPGTKYSNTVKCFSCGVMADVIDVIMESKEVDFKTALDILKDE